MTDAAKPEQKTIDPKDAVTAIETVISILRGVTITVDSAQEMLTAVTVLSRVGGQIQGEMKKIEEAAKAAASSKSDAEKPDGGTSA